MINIVELSEAERQAQQLDRNRTESIAKDFRRDGYIILKEIFSDEYIRTLYSEFTFDFQHVFSAEDEDNIIKTSNIAIARSKRRYQFPIAIKGAFNSPEFYANPFIIPILKQLFGSHFIISDLSCVTSLPGAKKMAAHRDGIIFYGNPLAHLLPSHAIGLLVPLVSFTTLNGPTRYWPGSHRESNTLNYENNINYIEPEIAIGSCILMDHRLVHSGNPNQSDQIRPLIYCNYSLPWYFDSNNFESHTHLLVDDDNYGKIPDTYKPLFQRRNMKLI